MKRGKLIKSWYPFWIDKWLFGSTRHELIVKEGDVVHDLRGIFIDLLTLSKKDQGYIRANDSTPYPLEQLAGMFCVPLDLLKRTIAICVVAGKLIESSPGIYYVASTEEYELKKSAKYEAQSKAEKTDAGQLFPGAGQNLPAKEKEKEKERIEKDIKEKPVSLEKEFAEFWEAYDQKVAKDDARNAYLALRRSGVEMKEIARALNGYHAFLKMKKERDGFEQAKLYPATFLRKNRWKDFVGIVYKPKL